MLKTVQWNRDLQLDLTACKLLEDAHKWSMQRSWTVMPTVALQDKKSKLAIQLARDLNSQLSQVTSPLCYGKTDSSHSFLTPV